MELPNNLKIALERIQTNMNNKDLLKISAELSASYIKRDKVGGRVVTLNEQAAVYAMARMPATYGAVFTAMSQAFKEIKIDINSLLDVGCGTGAASFAAEQIFNINTFTCLEREQSMIQIGKELMNGDGTLSQAKWIKGDMVNCDMPCSADMVVAAYSLNELTIVDRDKIVEKLWNATDKILIIIEAGTPECYKQLQHAREKLLKIGAYQLAPCPHAHNCQLEEGDWCHFYCRVNRSKMHKMLKGGECPYEDEKFCYMAFSKTPLAQASARVLRHPIIEKEKVKLKLCTHSGLRDCVVKKGVDDIYKTARKLDAGDALNCEGIVWTEK